MWDCACSLVSLTPEDLGFWDKPEQKDENAPKSREECPERGEDEVLPLPSSCACVRVSMCRSRLQCSIDQTMRDHTSVTGYNGFGLAACYSCEVIHSMLCGWLSELCNWHHDHGMATTRTWGYCQSFEVWCRQQQVPGRLGIVERKGRGAAQMFLKRQVRPKALSGSSFFNYLSTEAGRSSAESP